MKKTGFILFLILFIVSVFAYVTFYSVNFTGTTTNAYVTADSIVVKNFDELTVSIENTDNDSDVVAYKIVKYFGSWSGVSYDAVADTVAFGESYYYPIDEVLYGVKVLIKSNVSDSAATINGYFDFRK